MGLLLTLSGSQAASTRAGAHTEAYIAAEIQSLSGSVAKALSLSGLGSEAEADSEIQ